MQLNTLCKKWAWTYAKMEVFETEDAKMPVIGYKTMPNGERDFIKRVYNCPRTNEIIEEYEQTGTIVRYTNRGIYPIDAARRNKAKVEITFLDSQVFNIDYSDQDKRRLMSKISPK